mmetsp:Transcript_20581/g.45953  ORF Transcript_20581/g.45953 Transcript_20581/m.45953 type:complete len:97 (+) Transcript_20581:92-382(+)
MRVFRHGSECAAARRSLCRQAVSAEWSLGSQVLGRGRERTSPTVANRETLPAQRARWLDGGSSSPAGDEAMCRLWVCMTQSKRVGLGSRAAAVANA